MQCLHSPHKFIVTAVPHCHKHKGSAAMFRILTLKFGGKKKKKLNK